MRRLMCLSYIFLIMLFFGLAGNAICGESSDLPIVTTVTIDENVISGDQSADEGETGRQSNFPEDPEIYIAEPIPEPIAPEAVTQPESRFISYDVRTGEEVISDVSFADIPIADWVKGALGSIPETVDGAEEGLDENFTALSRVNNPEDHPWRVNVKLYYTKGGVPRVASGVLIDSMHVLTAGHCVHQGSGGNWVTDMVVVPAYENGARPYGDASAVQLHSWTGWTIDGDWDHDMGVIDLDRPIGSLTGWHGYGYDNDPGFYTGNTFHNPGYPAESPYDGQYMYYWYGDYDYTESVFGIWYGNEVGINSYSYGGQSGSG